MQSLAHETNAGLNGECGRLPNAVLGLPLEMSAVNTERCAGCLNAVPATYAMILVHMVMDEKWANATKG